jgi:hypothetical protein
MAFKISQSITKQRDIYEEDLYKKLQEKKE